MVIPTAIELELPKDFDVASYARFVHDVCSGRAVEWPALSPWWEGTLSIASPELAGYI